MNKSEEISAKTARLVDMLAAHRLGGVLVSSQPNFSWLTAGGTNGVDLSREAGNGALLVRKDGKRFVLANRIEMPRLLSEELTAEEFEPVEFPWEEEKTSPEFLQALAITLLGKDKALASDIDLELGTVEISAAVARCRYQLTSSEIERFRSLASDAAQTIGNLARDITPGETERGVARRVVDALAAHNIRAVVNLVAADDRIQQYRHPVPTDRRWEKTIMIVICAQRSGLTASLTRIVSSVAISDELRRRTLAAAQVNAQLIAATQPNASGADMYRLAARTYADAGFENEERLHHQGGATGYRTRDWVAHPACMERVHGNQAFAWNPSVTGTKVEETCIAFADGVEVLTRTPDWPQISVQVEDREYLSPDIFVL